MKEIAIAEMKPKMRFAVQFEAAAERRSCQHMVFEALAVDPPRLVAEPIASSTWPGGETIGGTVVFDDKHVRFLLPSQEYVNALLPPQVLTPADTDAKGVES